MTRGLLTILMVLAIALGLGTWSAQQATRSFAGFGQISAGGWSAQPNEGGLNADPYTRAQMARHGDFALGAAEGLRFHRAHDDNGQPLTSNCTYRLSGTVTEARAWTLASIELSDDGMRQALTPLSNSMSVLYNADGSFDLVLSKTIQPYNWRPLPQTEQFALVLTLYDTVFASNAGLTLPDLPNLEQVSCDVV